MDSGANNGGENGDTDYPGGDGSVQDQGGDGMPLPGARLGRGFNHSIIVNSNSAYLMPIKLSSLQRKNMLQGTPRRDNGTAA